jgi:hypothetical protein
MTEALYAHMNNKTIKKKVNGLSGQVYGKEEAATCILQVNSEPV